VIKSDLRREARAHRAVLARTDIARALAKHAPALKIAPGKVVGGYHALADEADPALLLARLAEQGCVIAFPRVVGKQAPLEFHRVPAGEVLTPGSFGIREPLSHWPVATPSVLLVPLLAFDAAGHRLGYGGGFYDRTLFALKSGPPLEHTRAIGIAYAGQERASLPREAHDMALDAILTEQGLRRFR